MQKPSTLTVSWAFGLEMCASATFLEVSSQSLCQGHLGWISLHAESQRFDPPPAKLEGVSSLSLASLGKHAESTGTSQGLRSVDARGSKTHSSRFQGLATPKFRLWPVLTLLRIGRQVWAYFKLPPTASSLSTLLFFAA